MRLYHHRRRTLGIMRWFGTAAAGGPGYPAGVAGPSITIADGA